MDTASRQLENQMPAKAPTKYHLSLKQLRGLTSAERPVHRNGKTVLVPNPGKKSYRFADGTPGAPLGFYIYVGASGSFYEVRSKLKGKAIRISLGSVQLLEPQSAYALALQYKQSYRDTGIDPRQHIQDVEAVRAAKGVTVGDAMCAYIEHLDDLVARGKVKPAGLSGAKDSLARLERPEVGLAELPISRTTDKQILDGWNALRDSAMLRSNRLSQDVKNKLKKHGDWWRLSRADLVSKLRFSGKVVEQAHAAGMAAAEHTMSDARRAVDRMLVAERKNAARQERHPVIFHNPFDVLAESQMFRSSRELRKHYEAARVRNPLGVDDAETGQKSLPSVLKSLLARRDMQNGWNATAVDYVLLTLLWGTRRNEGARIRWYDSCTKDELDLQLASWAWLAPKPEAKNPTTGLRGSQVFLHDTKSGEFQLLPVAYFAERVLWWRLDARRQSERALAREIERGEKHADKVRGATMDVVKRAVANAVAERARWRLDNVRRWVFPARNPKAKEGYYSDSKSLLTTVREDAGLLNLAKEIDIGLTTHDFRRTLGRFAGKLLPGHVVSQLLHHHKERDGTEMAKVSERYSEQEWPELREAMEKVDEAIIATSPRAWNILKGSDKPLLDERDDADLKVPKFRARRARNDRSKTKPRGRAGGTRQAAG
jgi:hypothetical protein